MYLSRPGQSDFSSQPVGSFSIRDFLPNGQVVGSQRCISMDIETHPLAKPYTIKLANMEIAVVFEWVQLVAEIWILSIPRYQIGRIHIDLKDMLSLGGPPRSLATWLWELTPEEMEFVEKARAQQPSTPITFQLKISGIAKMIHPSTNQLLDVVPLQGGYSQYVMELPHWQRLMKNMEYQLEPTHIALAGTSSLQHPSWVDATTRLEKARSHHRSGEGYAALNECLRTLESLVSRPYDSKVWIDHLGLLPEQKAEAIAELISGVATYCNKVGNHRSRDDRDASDDLQQMPLDHWETDLVVGLAQFVTAYALRLRTAGLLTED